MKIYAVLEDYTCECEQYLFVMAMFDNQEDALRYMQEEWDRIIRDGMYPTGCNCFDETQTFEREAYKDGDYTCNHHRLIVRSSELNESK